MGLLTPSPRNKLLAALPRLDLDRLSAKLRPVRLPRGHLLWEREQSVSHVYFLESGVASTIVRTHDGPGVETGVFGMEGLVGHGAVMGGAPVQHVVQLPATGYAMAAEDFRAEWGRGGALQKGTLSHLRFFIGQTSQTALCNRLHSLEARLCRWLLVVGERAETDELVLTQEFLAAMLGARRAGVTLAAGELRDRGLIDYRRGRVFLRNRAKIESCACECHRVIHDELAHLYSDYNALH